YAGKLYSHIERGWRLRVNHQTEHIEVGEASVHGLPAPPAIGALEYAPAVCPCVERGWRHGVNSERHDRSTFRTITTRPGVDPSLSSHTARHEQGAKKNPEAYK